VDANSGEPWSEMDLEDLRHSLDYGNTFAAAASLPCRDEDEVRQKAKELGLLDQPGKRVRVVRFDVDSLTRSYSLINVQ